MKIEEWNLRFRFPELLYNYRGRSKSSFSIWEFFFFFGYTVAFASDGFWPEIVATSHCLSHCQRWLRIVSNIDTLVVSPWSLLFLEGSISKLVPLRWKKTNKQNACVLWLNWRPGLWQLFSKWPSGWLWPPKKHSTDQLRSCCVTLQPSEALPRTSDKKRVITLSCADKYVSYMPVWQ